MRVRQAHILHGRDGYSLEIESAPDWAVLVDTITETVVLEWICTRWLGHFICAPPDWAYELGFGTDQGDPSTALPHRWSLGQLLFKVSQNVGVLSWKRAKREMVIPLTREQVAEHFPDVLTDWFADLDDYDVGVSNDAARWRPDKSGQ